MQELYDKIEKNHQEAIEERNKLSSKLDQLIGEVTKARDQIQQSQDDRPRTNQIHTSSVKKSQEIFKRIVSLNKDYYDVLSRQTKEINATFMTRQQAHREKSDQAEEEPGTEN